MMMKIAVVVALVACAFASPDDSKKEVKLVQAPGPAPHNTVAVYNKLGEKQVYVNKAAAHHGAGTGTAYYEGVPGTGVEGHKQGYGGYAHNQVRNYHGNSYGYQGNYGYDGYGFDGHRGAAPYAGSRHEGAYYNYGAHNDHFYGRGAAGYRGY